MNYPKQIKARKKIEALTGIKSSLDRIRSVIALVYLLYIANGRKASVRYSISEGNKIKIAPDLLNGIEGVLGHNKLDGIISGNPLITNQYEPLYVGVTLLMKLGYLKMEGRQNTSERTGGVRYPKQLYFANNILVLDLILQGFPETIRKQSLYEWLHNSKASNNEFEERVCKFITTCTFLTQFKLRDNSNSELFFQTEGIYKVLTESDEEVLYSDNHEFVGPTRIYNNVLKEGLEPWIGINRSVLYLKGNVNPDAESISQMLSTTLDIYNVKDDATTDNANNETDLSTKFPKEYPLQQIFYGAPGTGKSHTIKENENVKEANDKNLVFRTTFHPDSDYSTFVGAYKPTIKPVADKYKAVAGKDEEITYSFVPQAFLQAYIAAWNNPEENVYLIIEEINRGNCAQIFGDLFQLLDRDCDGFSEYPIMADNDLKKYLNGKDEEGKDVLSNKDGIKDGKLKLPKNLYIWATMNTSDQSLFPIDSAFKRRWDWVYVPIDTAKETWYIKVGENYYSWSKFLDEVNDKLLTDETAEDKHLGFYFCKATEKKEGTESDPNVITAETFVGKVLFYLWNDVFKVYGIHSSIGSSKDWPYRKFYQTDGKVDMEKVAKLMEQLKIVPEGGNEKQAEEAEDQ